MRNGSPSAHRFLSKRQSALRYLLDCLCLAGDEAPSRDSEQLLRDAAARVADAAALERKGALQ